MPWTETSPVDERQRFIADVRAGLYSMTELCARYGISQPRPQQTLIMPRPPRLRDADRTTTAQW
jgi:hypothetical protein